MSKHRKGKNKAKSSAEQNVSNDGADSVILMKARPVAWGVDLDDKARAMLCIGLLLLLVGAAFLPVLRNGFISWDDGDYILSNPHVRTGVSWENIRWAFGSFENSNWHPLTWISHMVDCEIFGLRAWGHHLTSLA